MNVLGRVVVEHLFKDHPSTGRKFMEGLRAAKEPTKENPKF